MSNYLITGYWGEPHVTAENDRGINAAIFGTGRFVLPVGEQFRAEYIGNNTIRIYDGKLMNNGAAAGIPAGEYVDILIANASQGMKRNDLIVFQYSQDASTLIEKGEFVVIQGNETSGTAADPTLTQEDLLTNRATFDQMALWRVPVSGTAISTPVQMFEVGGGGGSGGDFFIAHYGVTTFDDIYAAYEAGKVVLMIREGSTNAFGFSLLTYLSATQAQFKNFTGSGTSVLVRTYTLAASGNAWSIANATLVEKSKAVTGTGAITVTLEDNREYTYTAVTSLNMTVASVDCHGFVTFADSTPTVTITGQSGLMGDIASAAAGETWEFDCKKGYILWVKWGE